VSVFVDTNVIAYAYDTADPAKQSRAIDVLEDLWARAEGIVSMQVLQELSVVLTRKFADPLAPAMARRVVAMYAIWPRDDPTPATVLAASELTERDSISFWDAMIVVSAQRVGAETLLTEDLSHGRVFDGVRIENPFAP